MKTIERKTHAIDASNQPMGRLAVSIAILLRGKHRAQFQPNEDKGDFVVVKNVKAMKLTGNKLKKKIYYTHSGYPGGIRAQSMEKLFAERPQELLRKAVWGMLTKTRLRPKQINRLKFEK
ncbi:MAG: 50S ribosomal protein L13 [bacterium]|nr:50S ribosomal protein L13 [bacterium]